MIDYYKPIPKTDFPTIEKYEIENVSEPMVSLSELGFEILSVYFAKMLPGSIEDAYARETVANMLIKASGLLPEGYSFVIFDAYRPITVQQALWDDYRAEVAESHPGLDEAETDRLTAIFVSPPSYNEMQPSLHNTGGAIDLTIKDNRGHLLNMGTEFDTFRESSNTAYFEGSDNTEVINNRRMLFNVMTEAGFENLPSEWWHFEYGTKFWGYFSGKRPLYKGILD
ncbi:MAG: M15 family metallopeptidase, partial [Parasporobacterium sp.]|nr:M15 family metallopeptidase [Parasporobacterium sp.]